jgi:CheY-like chemotaxis protein
VLGRLRGLHILLAEDNLINQQIARELLEEHGIKVTVANNGHEAIEQLSDGHFDCVLMDVRMPEMDGIEATQLIRANPDTANTLVIAMTANARLEDREECQQAGMNDFISKPVDPAQFFRVLLKWLHPLAKPEDVAVDLLPESKTNAQESIEPTGGEVNTAMIAAMVKNNPDKIVRFTRTFLSSTREGIGSIHQALAAQDIAQLIQSGHRFKASCHSMGASRLSALMAQLEDQAKAGDLASLETTVAAIDAAWQSIETELTDYIRRIEKAGA